MYKPTKPRKTVTANRTNGGSFRAERSKRGLFAEGWIRTRMTAKGMI